MVKIATFSCFEGKLWPITVAQGAPAQHFIASVGRIVLTWPETEQTGHGLSGFVVPLCSPWNRVFMPSCSSTTFWDHSLRDIICWWCSGLWYHCCCSHPGSRRLVISHILVLSSGLLTVQKARYCPPLVGSPQTLSKICEALFHALVGLGPIEPSR